MIRRSFLCVGVIAGLALSAVPVGAKTTTLTMYQFWGVTGTPPIGQAFLTVAKEYERLHPNIKIKVVAGADQAKLVTAMAGGVGPDIAVADEKISSMALRKLMAPLDDLIKRDRINKDDFWAPSWRECEWDGKVWAMPWGSDPNFGMWYNKTMFKQAGLLDRGPETIQEMEAISGKIHQKSADGKTTRVGIVPWSAYGYPNSIYTWGWVFGGSFYDIKAKKVTADDPKIVRALKWMKDFGDRNGGFSAINGLSAFENSKCAMSPKGPWDLTLVPKMKNIELGIDRMPVDAGVDEDPTWVGGHKMIIPAGCKHRNEAWDFLKFMTADAKGSAILAEPIDWFPSYRKSDVYDKYRAGALLAPYIKILQKAAHQRPVMPASQLLYDQLDLAVAGVLAGKKEAGPALAEVTRVAQKDLDRILAKYAPKK